MKFSQCRSRSVILHSSHNNYLGVSFAFFFGCLYFFFFTAMRYSNCICPVPVTKHWFHFIRLESVLFIQSESWWNWDGSNEVLGWVKSFEYKWWTELWKQHLHIYDCDAFVELLSSGFQSVCLWFSLFLFLSYAFCVLHWNMVNKCWPSLGTRVSLLGKV